MYITILYSVKVAIRVRTFFFFFRLGNKKKGTVVLQTATFSSQTSTNDTCTHTIRTGIWGRKMAILSFDLARQTKISIEKKKNRRFTNDDVSTANTNHLNNSYQSTGVFFFFLTTGKTTPSYKENLPRSRFAVRSCCAARSGNTVNLARRRCHEISRYHVVLR